MLLSTNWIWAELINSIQSSSEQFKASQDRSEQVKSVPKHLELLRTVAITKSFAELLQDTEELFGVSVELLSPTRDFWRLVRRLETRTVACISSKFFQPSLQSLPIWRSLELFEIGSTR